MKYTLRPYQKEAVSAALNYMVEREGNPLIELPTGAGKSLVLADVTAKVRKHWPRFKVCVTAHVKELVEQNAAELESLLPRERISVYSAGLGRREFRSQTMVAGIQSIYRKAELVGPIDLLIVDEAHLVNPKAQGMYRDLIGDLSQRRPHLKVLGLTATPYRTGDGYLTEGEDALFRSVCYRAKVGDLVDQGYLSEIVTRPAETEMSMSGARVTRGEFSTRDLEAAAADMNTPAAVGEIVRFGAQRKSWLIFCVSVDHAKMVTSMLREAGIVTQLITGDTNKVARAKILASFKAGQVRAVVNVNVLTTGFNAPGTDLIAVLRPTASPGLWVQMVGRGFRKAEGKENCLLLDFGGNIERHGPIDAIKPRRKEPGLGQAPFKVCQECQLEVATAVRECPDCGLQFPPPKADAASKVAAVGSVIKAEPIRHEVTRVEYAIHKKRGVKSLRVDYFANTILPVAKEWVCFDHRGHPRRMAEVWWAERSKGKPPATTDEAMLAATSLREPKAIVTVWDGKHNSLDECIWDNLEER